MPKELRERETKPWLLYLYLVRDEVYAFEEVLELELVRLLTRTRE